MERLPDRYFDDMYAAAADPWQLADRWYEQRKYAMTMAMLPARALSPRVRAGLLHRGADRKAGRSMRPRDGLRP